MKNLFLYSLIFLCNLATFSQIPKLNDGRDTIKFTDDSIFEVTQFVNSKKFPVNIDDVKIYNKTIRGDLYDFGEPSFSISKNTITALSKKNRLLASQIRNSVYLGIGMRQNGKNVRLHGFKSIKNLNQLSACVQSKNVCRVEGEAVLIQIKVKDRVENFVLLRAVKPLDD